MELTTRLELQSQTTRLFSMEAYTIRDKGDEAITLHGGAFLQHLPLYGTVAFLLSDYNSFLRKDFNDELFPLRSQLLKES